MITEQNPISCDFDTDSITVSQATANIRETIMPITERQTVGVYSALGRVTAEDIVSTFEVPNHTNSAMDGYAVLGNDLPARNATIASRRFKLVGTSFAGAPYHGTVEAGQCVRIMTGGVMPDGTDTVVMQERAERVDDHIIIPAGDQRGANVRYAGEDIKAGNIVIAKGTRLEPAHLGLAASLGMQEISVFRCPKIAYFSNGDELRAVGSSLEIGEVYDSNRYTLHAMLSTLGVEQCDLGIVRDQPEAIAQTLKAATEDTDMVITTAGASVGDADYVKQTLARLGKINFWKVAIKPGRPMSFGTLNNSVFFGLPGNPVSVMVTFQVFVKVAIKQLSGEKPSTPWVFKAKTLNDLKKRPGRMEYQRGYLSLDENGETVVSSTGEQGSGILSSMSLANCYIILADESVGAKTGERVAVQLIDQAS